MPNLADLTDYDPQSVIPEADGIRRVYITGNSSLPVDNTVVNGVPEAVVEIPVGQPSRSSSLVNSVINKLFRDDDQRYQLWPEKIVREALTGANAVMKEGSNLGLRREDVTDIPAPSMPTKDSTWLGEKLGIAPVYATPQDSIIEKAQAISALAGTGGLAGTESGAVLNATPSLRPALKYKDRLYKGKEGQQHMDVIPQNLYPEFQKMAMSGEDISHYNFGFVNDKGHFLTREDALKYGIDNGLIDPQAGKYGALTSTLMADSSKPGTAIEAMAKTADPFFSALEHNVKGINQAKMNGDAWLGTLANKPGVKPEELEWTGLKSFLEENKGKPVTKAQIEEHLAANKIEVKEVVKGDAPAKYDPKTGLPDRVYPEGTPFNPTKYSQYQLPGGSNYREKLLTLPPTKNTLNQFKVINEHGHVESTWTDKAKAEAWAAKNNYKVREDAPITLNGGYKSSHWDEPNILAHMRMNDRTIDGKKSLHLEEIQSDWHQAGRDKGYSTKELKAQKEELLNKIEDFKKAKNDKERDVWLRETKGEHNSSGSFANSINPDGSAAHIKAAEEFNRIGNVAASEIEPIHNQMLSASRDYNNLSGSEGVPDAPFKKTWHELALKRALREAAEKGYDRLSWTPGEAQAARYDLSKSIDRVTYDKNGTLAAYDKNSGSRVIEKQASEKELADIVGKEAAEKLIKAKPDEYGNRKLENTDLKIGGEGMKGFYDKMIPQALEKLGKEHGVKVKQEKVNKPEIVPDPEVKGRYDVKVEGKLYSSFNTKAEAKAIAAKAEKEGKGTPVYYIDIPQSLRDTAMHKGFPLFSSTHMFTPVSHDPFNEKSK